MAERQQGYVLHANESRTPSFEQPGRFLATSDDTQGAFIVVEQNTEQPTPRSALHVHESHDEAIYVKEGELLITLGDVEHRVGPGDFVLMPRGIPHRVEAPGPVKTLLIANGEYEAGRANIFSVFQSGLRGEAAYAQIEGVSYVSD